MDFFQFSSLGHETGNEDNAAEANDMTLVQFDSGTKATSLDHDSMVHDNMALALHESVFAIDEEGP